MIDCHCHLDLYPNALDILSETNKRNYFTLAVTTSPRAWLATSRVFSGYEKIQVALGLHPEIVEKKFNELELLLSCISKTRFIGEVGIDGSKAHYSTLNKQKLVFESIIDQCNVLGGRVISIHSRGAVSDVLNILKKYPNCGFPVLHWFTGNLKELKVAIDMHCYFSINLKMLMGQKGRALVERIPYEFVLPESDGPFISKNGRVIFPWEAIEICDVLSTVWNVSNEQAKEILFSNCNRVMLEGN